MRRIATASLVTLALGLTACGGHDTVASREPTRATLSQRARIQIEAIDIVWPGQKDDICSTYRVVNGPGPVKASVRERAIESFEEGYGSSLEEPAADHLISLLETCP